MSNLTVDPAGVIIEFLEVAIHTLLYSRKLYPEGIFSLKKKYGVPVHVSVHPELNNYISSVLVAIKHLLVSQDLKQVDICFFTSQRMLIERFVFYFKEFTTSFNDSPNDSLYIQLKESFRAFCLKMSINCNYTKPLPKGANFKIFIHTTEMSSITMNETPLFQQFPWIEAEKRDITIPSPQIVPVRNIETDVMNIHVYLEENIELKSTLMN